MVKNPHVTQKMQETLGFSPWVGKIPWKRAWQSIPVFMPEESPWTWTEEPGGLQSNPLKYSCLKNPMDRGAWQATVHRVSKSWSRLSTHA